jgi:ADP-ribose pyrophosphatase
MQALIAPGTHLPALDPGQPHHKAATDAPQDYPKRKLGPDAPISWDIAFPDYSPTAYTSPKILKQPDYADPPIAAGPFTSFETLREDAQGLPLNPRGRTGITERGVLGKWGANFAADPVVTRTNPATGQLEMIAIQRGDNGQWAIPGGMVDKGEPVSTTLARELSEEALGKESVDSDKADELEMWFRGKFEAAHRVYAGYSDDRRNTDNAWMETQVFHIHLTDPEVGRLKLHASDDAAAVRWMPLTSESLEHLYSNHGSFVLQAVSDWQRNTGVTVGADGKVTPSCTVLP